MTSHFDLSDATLLILVARLDRDALAELFRRYCVVVLLAAGWTDGGGDAERTAADVFLAVWQRPEAFAAGLHSTRTNLIRATLRYAPSDAVRLATARLAKLDGWTYHSVAEILARPSQQVARLIREQLGALRDDMAP